MTSKAFRARNKSLLWQVHKLVGTGAMPKPLWYDVLANNQAPPELVASKSEKLREIQYLEDILLKKYYRKNPLEKDKVLNLYSESAKPPAAMFVSKQAALMRTKRMSEKEAYEAVQREMSPMKQISPEESSSEKAGEIKNDLDNTKSLRRVFHEYQDAESEFWQRFATNSRLKTE